MSKKNLSNIVIQENTKIIDAMGLIDKNAKGILIVVDSFNKILGTITDGDIRRAILGEKSIKTPIKELYNKECIYVYENKNINSIKRCFIENKIKFIPVVDNNKEVIDYYEIDDFINYNTMEKDNPVLIMAGGLGTRLKPLTDEIPKPMLKVGSKPILQSIIEQFKEYGFTNILISVNYKANIIENYFRDGRDFGVSIKYIKETKRLGTAGAIKLAEEYLNKPFFVINGDILTSVSFHNMLQYHQNNKALMTVGSRVYETQVPYGVLGVEETCITSLHEKPVYSYNVSGGIYVLNPEVIKNIPRNEYFDITELINKIINENGRISSFPISDYWIDIGKVEDYYKANDDIHNLF
ncbi:nucleotidyltransferase family protein [Clostridium beijerinckii]|uniref:nucleotidyltransferase family protein n=1 Tax=Clostridium beijerinckii TaxID=1520 RepID=UPI0002F818FB|nr:nucleotidyltransferase family protein [Clostridium beijerinckii]